VVIRFPQVPVEGRGESFVSLLGCQRENRTTNPPTWIAPGAAAQTKWGRTKGAGVTTRTGRLYLLVGLVAVLAMSVVAAGAEGPIFTGMWSADMTLTTVQTSPVSAFRSRLDAAAVLGPMALGTRSDFDDQGWLWQSFASTANAGFLSLQADVLYIPEPWTFAYGSGYAKLDFGNLWTTYHVGFLGSVFEGDVWRGAVFETGSSFGAFNAAVYLYFGATLDGILFTQTPGYVLCDRNDCLAPAWDERLYTVAPTQTNGIVFTGAEFSISSYLCYDVTLEATTVFSSAGFEYQEFTATVWSIGMVPVNFDAYLRFDTQTKSLTIQPKVGVGGRTCYGQVLVEFISTGPVGLIEGFSIYGLDLHLGTAAFAFRSLSVFDTTNYSLFVADGFSLLDAVWIGDKATAGTCGSAGEMLDEYWEVVGIGVYRGDPCCRTLSFVALAYFGDSSAMFDWMRSDFRLQLQVMDGLYLRSNVALDSNGVSQWTLGMSLAW